jgi:hypothetical protein
MSTHETTPPQHFLVTFEVEVPASRRADASDTYQCVLASATATAQSILTGSAAPTPPFRPCSVRVSSPNTRPDDDLQDWPRYGTDRGLVWTIVTAPSIGEALQKAAEDVVNPQTPVWEVLHWGGAVSLEGSGPEMLARERDRKALPSVLAAPGAPSSGFSP